MQGSGGRAITECFRTDRNGHILDTQYQLVARGDVHTGSAATTAWRPIPRRARAAWRVLLLRQQRPLCSRSAGSVRRQGQYYYGQYGPYGRVVAPRDAGAAPARSLRARISNTAAHRSRYIWGNRAIILEVSMIRTRSLTPLLGLVALAAASSRSGTGARFRIEEATSPRRTRRRRAQAENHCFRRSTE